MGCGPHMTVNAIPKGCLKSMFPEDVFSRTLCLMRQLSITASCQASTLNAVTRLLLPSFINTRTLDNLISKATATFYRNFNKTIQTCRLPTESRVLLSSPFYQNWGLEFPSPPPDRRFLWGPSHQYDTSPHIHLYLLHHWWRPDGENVPTHTHTHTNREV